MGDGVRVVFRLDDLGLERPHDLHRRLPALFDDAGVPFTGALVPCRRADGDGTGDSVAPVNPPPEVKAAVQSGVMEPALHGLTHERRSRDRWGRVSEFAGTDPDEQRERVRHGRRVLEERLGRKPVTFVPPWNSYDSATVTALEDLGFEVLSGGTRGAAPRSSSLAFLPATTRPARLRQAVEAASGGDAASSSGVVVALLHDYDLEESGDEHAQMSMDDLADLLRWAREHPWVDLITAGEAARSSSGLTARRYAALSRLHGSRARTLVPPAWRRGASGGEGRYPTGGELRVRRRRMWALAAGAGALGVGAGAAAGGLTVWSGALAVEGLGAAARAGSVALVVLVAFRALRSGRLHHRGFVALVAAVAFALVIWIAA